jgi:hypothetical protein
MITPTEADVGRPIYYPDERTGTVQFGVFLGLAPYDGHPLCHMPTLLSLMPASGDKHKYTIRDEKLFWAD